MASANLPQTVTARPNESRATGERLIPAKACFYPPAIAANDLLLVDFDRQSVKYGALYLVEEVQNGRVVWMGCRRFDRQAEKTIVDVSGEGEWRDFDGAAAHWRIAGEVKQVFKPSL